MCEKNEDKVKENLAENDSPLELKDWILFLSSESYQSITIVFLLFAIVISIIALVSSSIEVYGFRLQQIVLIAIIILWVLIGLLLFLIFRQKKCMDKIVKDIICGELADVNKVRKQWKECKKPERWKKCKKLLINCKKLLIPRRK